MTVKTSRVQASKAQIGIIGGSGLYQMEGLTNVKEVKVATPFGKPSDSIILGSIQGLRVGIFGSARPRTSNTALRN